MGGGGGGDSGGSAATPNVPTAGPPRPMSSYPQYNPIAYQGMQPGAMPPMGGMGQVLQSHMPSVNGQMGFGGIPANALIQALMAGYAGVPSATQATGAAAPGMSAMPTPAATTTPTQAGDTSRGGRVGSNILRRYPNWVGDAGAGGSVGVADRYSNWYSGGEAGSGGGNQGGSTESSSAADAQGGTGGTDTGMGADSAGGDTSDGGSGDGSDGSDSNGGGGNYARGGMVKRKALRGPNPPGPDDGYAGLDAGEYVVRASQAKKHRGVLKQINAGRFGNKTHKGT